VIKSDRREPEKKKQQQQRKEKQKYKQLSPLTIHTERPIAFQSGKSGATRRCWARLDRVCWRPKRPGRTVLQQIGDIFVIAMEITIHAAHKPDRPPQTRHPPPVHEQFITPAIRTRCSSFARLNYHGGKGAHPSDPNYIWAEAGSDFRLPQRCGSQTCHATSSLCRHLPPSSTRRHC